MPTAPMLGVLSVRALEASPPIVEAPKPKKPAAKKTSKKKAAG